MSEEQPPERRPARQEPIDLEAVEIHRADVLCVGPIMAYSLFFLITSFVAPPLIGTHPLLLATLRGSTSSLVAVGAQVHAGHTPLWLALLAPLPTMVGIDPFYYWAGRRYGRWILNRVAGTSPRQRRRAERAERFFGRWGIWAILFSYYIPLPAALFYVAAGETRMRFALFLAADLGGTLSWIVLALALGWRLGDRATTVALAISRYGLWVTVVLIVGYVGFSVARARRPPP